MKPGLASWGCTRRPNIQKSQQNEKAAIFEAHCLAAIVKPVANTICRLAIRVEESSLNETPKVEITSSGIQFASQSGIIQAYLPRAVQHRIHQGQQYHPMNRRRVGSIYRMLGMEQERRSALRQSLAR